MNLFCIPFFNFLKDFQFNKLVQFSLFCRLNFVIHEGPIYFGPSVLSGNASTWRANLLWPMCTQWKYKYLKGQSAKVIFISFQKMFISS